MKTSQADRAAWMNDIVATHEPALVRYTTRITRNAESARDVVQDVLLRLCDRDAHAQMNGELAPWLYAACRNRAIDIRRKESRMQGEGDVFFTLKDATPAPHDVAAEAESTSHVLETLAQLPANQQEVICLRFQHGLSYKEIASVVELSVNHVGVLIHNAIKTLRDRIT